MTLLQTIVAQTASTGKPPCVEEIEAMVNYRAAGGIGRLIEALQQAAVALALDAPARRRA